MTAVPASVPVTPSGAAARQLLLQELAKPAYAASQPTLFDRIANGFLHWFEGLFDTSRSGAAPVLLAVALGVVAALLIVALLLFGRPRVNRRGAATSIFGASDRRSAVDLRRAAEAAMARGDWSAAVLERFRAIARGLDERTLVAVLPGTTAAAFAAAAGAVLPAEEDALHDASALFDRVRYAGRVAVRADAERVAQLDARVAAARVRGPERVRA